ncbi:ATP-binding protein [Halanaerobium salsuginis]|uniref:Uncharacterized protein n=1 Tax=Halanaerobium salsuginis TaxID=29563 RepID=A0A1I4IE89_9FIRM|nr:ATP-binding protein [Halanaerobium salsuginis]SFL52615.1 hypothetical protein SAMN02983006_01401 [Halanaerobium salsuginis]
MNKEKIYLSLREVKELILFKKLKESPFVGDLLLNIAQKDRSAFNNQLYQLIDFAEANQLTGDILQSYLKFLLISDENPFTQAAEKNVLTVESSLYQLAYKELTLINKLLKIKLADLLDYFNQSEFNFLTNYSPQKSKNNRIDYNEIIKVDSSVTEQLIQLNQFFYQSGVGILNQSSAFYWQNNNLQKINNPDQISFKQLISYSKQQQLLIENTQNFLNDKRAHNVLLYGDSGTGKSSSVKALLNKFASQGLRLVEINNQQIKELPVILKLLSQRGLYFIIFMDDLSFEEFETDYKYLKAIMEGGIEARPQNVLFYATSNRRHLVREKWQDRQSEVHKNDILNEKLSLAERFGLTIMFNTPEQEKYLEIVHELAQQEEIELTAELLDKKALRWSKWNNGRSGRSARQFIDQLLAEKTN